MPEFIDIQTCDDPRDVIHRVVEHLAAGELVGLPTNFSYTLVAQASQVAAVERLREIADSPLVLAAKTADELLDFAPDLGRKAERLFRRLWPGPVIVELTVDDGASLIETFPEPLQSVIAQNGQVRLRIPEHPVFSEIQRLVPSPLVLSSDPTDGIIRNPKTLADRFCAHVQMIVDDGPSLHPGRCTMIRVEKGGWTILEPGLLDSTMIKDRTNFGVIFVCTGNTCRSPLAEAIFRKLLAERLECSEEELPARGYYVASAGLAAGYGMPAAAESLALAEEFGLRLDQHRSRPLTDELLDRADYIFTMTAGHRDSILSVRPDLADRVHLLSREGIDIADPIGGGPADYEQCRTEIERELLVVLEHLPIDPKSMRD